MIGRDILIEIKKAMKRKVDYVKCHREPQLVRRGTGNTIENGLGAAYRLRNV